MTRITQILLIVVLALGYFRGELWAQANPTDMWSRLAQGGVAVLLRHALAPGFSDPPNFKLGDCATQRNLSDTGSEQARQIGLGFRQHGITIDKVGSSPSFRPSLSPCTIS